MFEFVEVLAEVAELVVVEDVPIDVGSVEVVVVVVFEIVVAVVVEVDKGVEGPVEKLVVGN